jgi:hypothetical protein
MEPVRVPPPRALVALNSLARLLQFSSFGLLQDFQEFSRSDHSNSQLRRTAHVPNVVRHKISDRFNQLSRLVTVGFRLRFPLFLLHFS